MPWKETGLGGYFAILFVPGFFFASPKKGGGTWRFYHRKILEWFTWSRDGWNPSSESALPERGSADFQVSNEKRAPGCLGWFWGWNPTQLYGDFFFSQYKDPVINQPGFPMASRVRVFWPWEVIGSRGDFTPIYPIYKEVIPHLLSILPTSWDIQVGGGFRYFWYFSENRGNDSQFDEHILQLGWFNHQPVEISGSVKGRVFLNVIPPK